MSKFFRNLFRKVKRNKEMRPRTVASDGCVKGGGDVLDDLVGLKVERPGKCEVCPREQTGCKKISMDGIGDVCLVEDER